jgi:hypothetical protein
MCVKLALSFVVSPPRFQNIWAAELLSVSCRDNPKPFAADIPHLGIHFSFRRSSRHLSRVFCSFLNWLKIAYHKIGKRQKSNISRRRLSIISTNMVKNRFFTRKREKAPNF